MFTGDLPTVLWFTLSPLCRSFSPSPAIYPIRGGRVLLVFTSFGVAFYGMITLSRSAIPRGLTLSASVTYRQKVVLCLFPYVLRADTHYQPVPQIP